MLVLVPLCVFDGWVLSILWGWFVVPLGVVALTIPGAIGLRLVVGLFVTNRSPKKLEDIEEEYEDEYPMIGDALRAFVLMAHRALALALGWILNGWFMP